MSKPAGFRAVIALPSRVCFQGQTGSAPLSPRAGSNAERGGREGAADNGSRAFIYYSQRGCDAAASLQPSTPWGYLVPHIRQARWGMTTNLKRLGT